MIGYAYGSRIGSVTPTVGSVEVSPTCIEHHRRGVGRALYLRLLEELLKKASATPTQALLSQTRARRTPPGCLASSSSVSQGRWPQVRNVARRCVVQGILRDSPPSG